MSGSPLLPSPRGPLSEFVIDHLREGRPVRSRPPRGMDDPVYGDDSQLALHVCYELHYRSFGSVADELEWDPGLLAFRRSIERDFERQLRRMIPHEAVAPVDVPQRIRQVISGSTGPSLSMYMLEEGTTEQFREFAIHRSAYQLKEADPHTWAIPRLAGRPKAALIQIQADEYGGGTASAMHSQLFADTMEALGLDCQYGAYLDLVPGTTLATGNLISFLGLHRRWRGALVGHLTVFEMTSVIPMARYSDALAKLGFQAEARRFYDVHVVADAEHEEIALNEMAARLAQDEPAIAADIVFGAEAVTAVEQRFAETLLSAWSAGESSLLGNHAPRASVAAAVG